MRVGLGGGFSVLGAWVQGGWDDTISVPGATSSFITRFGKITAGTTVGARPQQALLGARSCRSAAGPALNLLPPTPPTPTLLTLPPASACRCPPPSCRARPSARLPPPGGTTLRRCAASGRRRPTRPSAAPSSCAPASCSPRWAGPNLVVRKRAVRLSLLVELAACPGLHAAMRAACFSAACALTCAQCAGHPPLPPPACRRAVRWAA